MRVLIQFNIFKAGVCIIPNYDFRKHARIQDAIPAAKDPIQLSLSTHIHHHAPSRDDTLWCELWKNRHRQLVGKWQQDLSRHPKEFVSTRFDPQQQTAKPNCWMVIQEQYGRWRIGAWRNWTKNQELYHGLVVTTSQETQAPNALLNSGINESDGRGTHVIAGKRVRESESEKVMVMVDTV